MEPNEFVPCKVVIPSLEVKYEIFIRLLKPVERSSLSQRVPYSTVIHVTRGGGGGGGRLLAQKLCVEQAWYMYLIFHDCHLLNSYRNNKNKERVVEYRRCIGVPCHRALVIISTLSLSIACV